MTTSIKDKLLAVQRACAGKVGFDSVNPHFRNKYASLETVLTHLLGKLNEVGLVLTQKVALVDGFWTVRTVVMDETALEELCCMPIVNPKGDAQGFGSALSYAKRYSLMSAFCLVGGEEDDDGEGAQGRDTRRENIQAKKPIYDGSEKDRLFAMFKEAGLTVEKMKELAPKLIGKTWDDCQKAIDYEQAMIKETGK